jgi:hypothetical protein
MNIASVNVGLVLKQRRFLDIRTTSDDTPYLTYLLLDCFDGFNMSYYVKDFSGPANTRFSLSEDHLDRYLMETFNQEQTVKYSFHFK